MSDLDREPVEARAAMPETDLPTTAPKRSAAWRVAAMTLAGALVLFVALVTTAPFWASLLPWGPEQREERALAGRLDRLAAAQTEAQQQIRHAAAEMRQQIDQSTTQTNAALQRIGQRVGALEARPAVAAGDTAEIRQEIAKMSSAASDLAVRVDAIDKAFHAQTGHDTTDTALALTLLQIRDAVAAGRPFAAEYETLARLARRRQDIAEAAAPLADPAKSGIASAAVLAKGLRDLAQTVATPKAQPAEHGWTDAVLVRLRGLVTTRRVDGDSTPDGPQGAVNAAELALAGGDVAGAVAALDKLTGTPAEAAGPWLRMARQRLAVDTALQRVESLLTSELGSSAAPPNAAGPSH